jgi:hypothetical protein
MIVGNLPADVQKRAPFDLGLDRGNGVAPEKGVAFDDFKFIAGEFPGLSSTASGMPTLPMSCRIADW